VFRNSAKYYDAIYSWKDYAGESTRLLEIIQAKKKSGGKDLLDVACGTGSHFPYLREHYKIEGMDLDDQMLEVARQKFPSVKLHCADMTNFDLGRQFDVVTCLFSAIGYVKTIERLNRAISRMAAHMKPAGLLIVEPWLAPEQYRAGQVHALYEDRPNLKIVRMNTSEVRGDLSILEFHYLVGTPSGVEYFTETHEIGLFTEEQYRNAFEAAGMDVEFDPAGLMGRGLWIATRP